MPIFKKSESQDEEPDAFDGNLAINPGDEIRIRQRKEEEASQPPPHGFRWLKWTLIGLLSVIVLAGVAALAGYLYITQLPLQGEPRGRVNILVIGVDDAAQLSDTLMIASIDTRERSQPQLALTSIPRDLWVDIPGFNEAKINAAYSLGQHHDYPGGGPALSKATVEETFNLPIHYYLAVDFSGFTQAVDTVDGIDVTVEEAIDDSRYPDGSGGQTRYQISAGEHHLDGAAALQYARSRFSTSDFDRAKRQQQIVKAFLDRLFTRDIMLDYTTLSQLQSVYAEHVQTDMSMREVLKAATIVRRIDNDDTIRFVLNSDPGNYLVSSQRAGYVLLPRSGSFEAINAVIADIFDSPPDDETE